MNRYYLVHDKDLPNIKDMQMIGPHSFIALDGHGDLGSDWNVVCVEERDFKKNGWIAFPSLLSRKTIADSDVPQEILAGLGMTGEETAMEAAELFATIMPQMEP